MPYLVLVRHGQSEWNLIHKMTGQSDVPLTELGVKQAQAAAEVIRDLELHVGYTSELQRAYNTLAHILESNDRTDLAVTKNSALNERRYGIYEGRFVQDLEIQLGKDKLDRIRQSWDEPIPEGESLKQTHARVKKYYENHIFRDLQAGRNVIVAAHRNVLRTIIKDLEHLPDSEVTNIKLANAQVNIYEIDEVSGEVISKQIRTGKA
jgi:2,3-bisphosphoglycerate-dependent phosphoglycerate mutase